MLSGASDAVIASGYRRARAMNTPWRTFVAYIAACECFSARCASAYPSQAARRTSRSGSVVRRSTFPCVIFSPPADPNCRSMFASAG